MSFWDIWTKLTEFLIKLIGPRPAEVAPPAVPPVAPPGGTRPTLDAQVPTKTAKLAVIVGHEKVAPGADLVDGTSEYTYNTEIAKLMVEAAKGTDVTVQTFLRDGVGISGAYDAVRRWKPTCAIELHFNSYNGVAFGTETLCSSDKEDQDFAMAMQGEICKVFSRAGLSRGLKIDPERGGQSVTSLPDAPNCLVEPFFGDHPGDAKMAVERKKIYAASLVSAVSAWAAKRTK